jgi:hypothetical protein
MSKKHSKLSLNRETVRTLNPDALAQAGGAWGELVVQPVILKPSDLFLCPKPIGFTTATLRFCPSLVCFGIG